MSFGEIAGRIAFYFKKQVWRSRISWIAPAPNIALKDTWTLPLLPDSVENEYKELIGEANCYLKGEYHLLNISYHESDIDWSLDPQTGVRTPVTFGLDINYRDTSVAGNVKNIWEKNRHHHLTVLAQAFALTGDKRYADEVERQLTSWISQNPFPKGVNWTSALEIGVRLISWVWIERLLRGSTCHERIFGEDGKLWPSIYWSQWMISKRPSYGSSANNHLLGEMAGLFVSSIAWPFFKESSEWIEMSQKILEHGAPTQTFVSGLNREQAFSYHIFSLEFLLLAGQEGDRLNHPFSAPYKQWVKRMLEVIPLVMDVGGNLPRYGDGDDGMALQLRPIGSSRIDWLYRLGRLWLKAKVPLPGNCSGVLASAIVLSNGKDIIVDFEAPYTSRGFKDAGIFILASNRGNSKELFCLADAGALGFLSIAAHGHADALSFTLSVGGFPVIIDSGTYTYHYDPIWRDYFRGTKAHNTIVIDGEDQSVSGGPFNWTLKAQSKMLKWNITNNGAALEAEHYGYTRLPGKIIHNRKIVLENQQLEIFDHLKGRGDHSLEWRLHLNPTCEASIENNSCAIKWSSGRMVVSLDRRFKWRLAWGENSAGWSSSSFNIKEPTYTLIGSLNAKLPISINNCLNLSLD